MSNYTKSFNFRNGVQVDDDNFVVNAAGLVGIGTTKPEKLLDVRGNASITGITSLTGSVVTGVITAGNIKIDALSGVLTATRFVGDASGLTNIVAIATDGWIANTGTLSTTAKVGVGTLSPISQFEVLGDSKLVGFTTLSGITTSVGTLFANQLSVSGVSTFVGLTSLSTLFVSSTSTFTGAIDANGGATVDNIQIGITGDNEIDTSTGNLTIDSAGGTVVIDDQVNVSGILTAKSFSGPTGTAATFTNGIVVGSGVTIEPNGQANFVGFVTFNTGVNVTSGLSTFSDNVNISGTNRLIMGDTGALLFRENDDLKIAVAGSNNLDISANVTTMFAGPDANKTVLKLTSSGAAELYNDSVKKFETVSIGASVYGQLNIARLNGGASTLSTHFGSVRYGNENASFGYSTRRSLDLINTDSGNINFYLNLNNISGPAGDFRWFKGTAPKMTLVGNTGNLGIGKTDPTEKLHVAGIVTTTSDSFVAGKLSVKGNLEMTGASSEISGNLTGLVNAVTGISTFTSISVTDKTNTQFDGFGVNKNPDSGNIVDIIGGGGEESSKVFVSNNGSIGIGTTRIDDTVNINALQSKVTLGSVGVGTTNPQAVVDFSAAGQGATGASANRMYAYLPTVNNSQEAALVGMRVGALVFNIESENLKFYNGSAWANV